jgi:hypothetical protein
MKKDLVQEYTSPLLEILSLASEGIICASDDQTIDVGIEDWGHFGTDYGGEIEF